MNLKKRPGKYRWNISFHKEKKISFLYIAMIVFIIAIVVVFFVWPNMRWVILSSLGWILPVIALLMVLKVWVMRERQNKEKGE